MDKATIKDIKIRGKIVLVRTDYNVPLKDGEIKSDLRIRASLPTIEYLRDKGAKKIILMSHLGRPDGQKVRELSLKPVADRLAELLKSPVAFVDDVSGPDVEEAVENLPRGGILLLENLRFYPGEEKNSDEFAREILESTHAEVFVQDGFAVIHRAHASTSAITRDVPSVAGLLLEKEVSALTSAATHPKQPLLVLIGGAKVEDKQPLIDKFLPLASKIAVGGKIAADGYTSSDPKIYVAEDFSDDSKKDLGEKSIAKITELIKDAKTVIWNGSLGLAEEPAYANASIKIAETIGHQPGLTSIICGGDTAGLVECLAEKDDTLNYTLISTGGGASLELLLGLPLPGLDSLDDAD